MPIDHRAELRKIRSFPSLIRYLRDEMGWPIEGDDFEDLTFEYTPEELGIDPKNAAKIQEIKRLRPLSASQPWGIFFVKFEPKQLPVVALRRILGQVALKKRASANSADRAAWAADDLLFVSNYGEGETRQISFAHFSQTKARRDLPTLKVLGWDNLDTALHLDDVAETLNQKLAWPDDEDNVKAWRETWQAAFTLRHREVIATSRELSIRLAKLARDIRDRIRSALAIETENGPLTKLMNAFQETLVHDLDADGFADMYAQTIAYGLLSARIADPHKKTADDFAGYMRTNPFLHELMETFLRVGGRRGKAGGAGIDFDELGVSEVVQLLDDANMEAVVRDFGDRNPQEDPVIHFYELFLKEYDAEKRMQRGVFYTPRPVVSYIVRSVHEMLRTEFGLEDGLADTATWGEMAARIDGPEMPKGATFDQAFVQILDPATGTGTFLVEVINLIYKTMTEKWQVDGYGTKKIGELWNDYVPNHLLPRLHGYELLMAPYAIAHMKIGLKLYETGYRFASDERVRVYLTNSLEQSLDMQMTMDFIPALAHEAAAVNQIKRTHRFTVIIGNPPYAGHSSNTGEWARALVARYRTIEGKKLRLSQGKWLQNDYVKFIALSETIIGQSGWGLLGFVTDHSYLDGDTFPGLRHAMLKRFSKIHILNLHGSITRRETPPGGGTDENVFDIQQGVAVTIAVASRQAGKLATLHVSDLWGPRPAKFTTLMGASNYESNHQDKVVSRFDDRYLFVWRGKSADRDLEYERFDGIDEIFSVNGRPAPGFLTTHDSFAIAFSRDEIVNNIERFLSSRSEAEARDWFKLCSQKQWNYDDSMKVLRDSDWRKQITRCLYRPFDYRWTVYDPHVLVHRRERVNSHLIEQKNLAILTTRMTKGDDFGHVFVTDKIADITCLSFKTSTNAFIFPLSLQNERSLLSGIHDPPRLSNIDLNLTDRYLEVCGDLATPEAIFCFCYAILHSADYRKRYGENLLRAFPRIPRPCHIGLFDALTRLGQSLIDAHLLKEEATDGVLNGHGENIVGVRMPKYDDLSSRVWINPGQHFDGVSRDVWEYKIGSYRVSEKWLKDRKGRTLTKDDIDHYQKIVVALSETIRIMKEIDEVIDAHGGWPDAFQSGEDPPMDIKQMKNR